MRACRLTIDFHLGGCRSLKEKRQRLKGLRDRFGRAVNVAVCESDHQDAHQRSQWSFIASAADVGVVERLATDNEIISVAKVEELVVSSQAFAVST